MLWNRIRGLWNAYHVILAVILTALYWVILIAISPMLSGWSIAHYPPFILYSFAAVFGLIIAAVRGRSGAATLLAGGFVDYHTLAFKQTVYIGVVLLLTLALGAGAGVPSYAHRPVFLFCKRCVVFLICHFFIPGKLADQLFPSNTAKNALGRTGG